MAVKVISKDANRQLYVSEAVKKLSEVAQIVDDLRMMGHTEIMVGTSAKDALPYAQWKIAAQGVTVDSVDHRLP